MPPPASPHGLRVSLRDIARILNVSHVTVSLALRDDSRIRPERRLEIQAAARALGYEPDPMLSSLSAYRQAKRTKSIHSTIAWINQWAQPKSLHAIRDFEAYWQGACETAAQLGYRLEEFAIGSDMSGPRLQQIFLTRNVRGILIPPHIQNLDLPGFDWIPFSLVRFGVSVSIPRAHVVTSDQMNCAALAFKCIHDRGYRRIGFVSSTGFDRRTGGSFRAGYLSTQDALLPVRRHLLPLILEESLASGMLRHLRAWIKRSSPDAILTTLPSLPQLLKELGLRVPQDVALAATSVTACGTVDTGVDQNSYEIGQVGMRTLAGLIQQNERGVPSYCRRILVEGRWIEGTSLPPKTHPGTSRSSTSATTAVGAPPVLC